ncbi:hypothetical protein COV93_03000, partial [Candidatus Woesearchaeota archaeon CG11_big_fil_rev_8_21_14_0_20_43_8]
GDPGYGFVGPKTRAKLAEVFEGGTVPAQVETPATPPPATGELPAPAASTPPTTQSLEAQLSDLLEQLTELQTELDAKTSE